MRLIVAALSLIVIRSANLRRALRGPLRAHPGEEVILVAYDLSVCIL